MKKWELCKVVEEMRTLLDIVKKWELLSNVSELRNIPSNNNVCNNEVLMYWKCGKNVDNEKCDRM